MLQSENQAQNYYLSFIYANCIILFQTECNLIVKKVQKSPPDSLRQADFFVDER